jgi:putative solute:sodium symporter small subunit
MVRRKSHAEGKRQPGATHDAPLPEIAVNPALAHWERTRRLTGVLLVIWFFVTFGVIFFARELSHLSLLGWPISYYMAAQGATLVYVILVGFYAWRMRRLERTWTADNSTVRRKNDSDAT